MKKRVWLTGPYVFWIVIFTILPVIVLLWYALYDSKQGITFEHLREAVKPVHLKAFWNSILISFECTVICLLLAYPLALCIRALKLGKRSTMIMIVIAPMWMNYVLRIMSWQLILSKNGLLNSLLTILHLPNHDLGNSSAAIVIGMIYDYLPFMLLPVYNSIMSVGDDVIEAARDLGANKLTVFAKILLPLTIPGISSGIVMVFVPALTTFAISDMLGGGKVMLIGNIIEQEFISSMNWKLGAALSLVLMIVVIPGLFISPTKAEEQNTIIN